MLEALDFPDRVPELRGDSVTLRELSEDDVPAWFERASDPESSALSGDPVPQSIDICFEWLQLHRERFRDQKGIRWGIVATGSNASVGGIGLSITSREERVGELGAVIARAYWNRGIGTIAARLVLRYGFDTLGLTEIRADLLRSNLASRRVLEKLGFRFLRVIPDYRRSDTGSQYGFLYVLRSQDATAA
jgi:[ribosomal protein S5]-alanine N-acetyltransferase